MKGKRYIYIIMFVGLFISCQLTSKLEQTNYRPIVNQPGKVHETFDSIALPQVIRYKDINGVEQTIINASTSKDKKTGENIMTVEIADGVTVIARSKTIPERFGMVNLDFVVTVPKVLIDKRWMLTITPQLQKKAENIKLKDVVINGELYRLYQAKGEAMYSTLSDRYNYFNRDTSNIWEYFYKKYNLKYNTDARLDTIIASGSNFNYYYTQELATDETKKIDLSLKGNIFALDKSTFVLPLSDTISYYISSMIQFIDRSPRFKRKIIERHAEANYTAHITFPVGKSTISENLADNKSEIEKVKAIIKQLTWSSEFLIDSINMTASSSPEGNYKANNVLAKSRALSLKRYFAVKMDDAKGVDTLFHSKWIAEDWQRIYDLITKDNYIVNRDEILEHISTEKDADIREKLIKKYYPTDYKYIRDSIYPSLRTVEFQFNLHRTGMTKDTIHTTTPDTYYADGIKLLEERKYKDALAILIEYDDFNTAIAYMSLGYDVPAYNILLKEKKSPDTEYLLAILSARLGREEEAVKRYLHSCELDDSKAWRGALDPEINKLIKAYNLNNDLKN